MIIQLAGCVVQDEKGRIGLLHRNTAKLQQWELPGGKLEPDETAEDAATRELHEELGVTVKLTKKLGTADFTQADRSYHYIWFLGEISRGTPNLKEPETFDEFNYFSAEELKDLPLSANIKELIEQHPSLTF